MAHPTTPTMESTVETLLGRKLTAEESQVLIRLRDQYGYDDSDPLVVVLAMLGAHKILAEELPKKITDAAKETIELHRLLLREQASVVAKDLVGALAGTIHNSRDIRFRDRFLGFACGITIVLVILAAIKFFKLI